MMGSAVYQTSVLLHTALASLSAVVGEGAVAALYFANRLVQLPLALFGTASAQASLPALSEQAAHDDLKGFHATLLSVIRMVAFVILPSSLGLMVMAFPIVGGLFERGAFDHRSTVMTAQALICYCPGLLAYSISKIFTGAFYALHDTWTPVRLAIEALVMNLLASLLLMWPLQVSGLALAAAITNSLNAYRLIRCLERRLGAPLLAPVRGPLGRILVASIVMAAGCQVMWMAGDFASRPLIGLPVTIVLGLLLYGVACAVLRVRELSTALQWVSRLGLPQPFASE
jgi:putative peptidoglycan lipid II flippase